METNQKEKVQIIAGRFRKMRLPVMAEDLLDMAESGELFTMEPIELLDRITSNEEINRKNNKIRLLKNKASLSQKNACLEELEYTPERRINKAVIDQLSTNSYIVNHRNVVILGACGTGKSFLCNALGVNACNDTYRVLYKRMFELLADIDIGILESGNAYDVINKYAKPDLLIIDDFLIHPVSEKEAENLFKILEYRYGNRSTIICSQLDPEEWHRNLGSDILADSILDRIIPNAYKLVLSGDSMRKKKI